MKGVRAPIQPFAWSGLVGASPVRRRACCRQIPRPELWRHPKRTFFIRPRIKTRAVETLNLNRMRHEAYEYYLKRRNLMALGAISSFVGCLYVTYLICVESQKPTKLDSGLPPGTDPFSTEAGSKRKTVVHDEQGREMVPTGNETVPTFPRTVKLGVGAVDGQEPKGGTEYTLVGLGMRSVSFLGIYVYLVGLYVATADIAALQGRLVREINPIATTLIPSEREELRRRLLDPVESERLWQELLRDVGPRSLFRIVPVKDTDFGHLRDGFVRAITARAQVDKATYGDESLGLAMREFRGMFRAGKAPKKTELLMVRDGSGAITMVYDGGDKQGRQRLGKVDDERLSRALWLNYLAGARVASEPARTNIVHGIMEFVERPVGTVATQVV